MLILPDFEEIGDGAQQKLNQFAHIQLLVARRLEIVNDNCLSKTRIEKLIGNKIRQIGVFSFESSYFLQQINLKNVERIGRQAFSQTNLQLIQNNLLQRLTES